MSLAVHRHQVGSRGEGGSCFTSNLATSSVQHSLPASLAGELWTRAWEAMPLPDLTQCAVDAAAVLAEVAAVAGPAVAAQGPGQGFHPWPAVAGNVVVRQQDAPQQQKQVGRQTQRRRLDSEGGRHGRRSYRSIGDSSSSDSGMAIFPNESCGCHTCSLCSVA